MLMLYTEYGGGVREFKVSEHNLADLAVKTLQIQSVGIGTGIGGLTKLSINRISRPASQHGVRENLLKQIGDYQTEAEEAQQDSLSQVPAVTAPTGQYFTSGSLWQRITGGRQAAITLIKTETTPITPYPVHE
ncbi:MAG: hypothetical protein GPOALKHO_000730 [Sodalis sp.]|nr:MAG: hypothetical protein GPOALKHO_000730 [Sodalis sp.]